MCSNIAFDQTTLKELRTLPLAEEEKEISYFQELFEDQNTSTLWTCAICHSVVVKDPILLVPCGHHFCGKHIYEYFNSQNKRICPYDRRDVETVLNNLPQIREMLKSFIVYCPKKIYNSAPCQWKGKLEMLTSHLENECDYVNLACKCGESIPRNGTHLDSNCKCHKSMCLYCGEDVIYRLLQAHEKACQESQVIHKCGKSILRKNFAMHEQICEDNYVECKYKKFGCKEKLHEKDIEVHYSIHEAYHFSLVQGYSNSAENRMNELEAELNQKPRKKTHHHLPLQENAQPVSFFLKHIKGVKNDIVKNIQDLKFQKLDMNIHDLPSLGPYLLSNGSVYIGQWKDGLQHGRGISFFADGSIYEGFWENGVPNGDGRFLRENGDMYQGEIRKGRACGQGKYYQQSGRVYEGQFLNNEKSGQGIEKFPDGSEYKGSFLQGERNGKGIYHSSLNNHYEGDFVQGKMHGKGVYKVADGGIYKGDFNDNAINGYGEYSWPDGRRYQGEWLGGMQHGKGVYFDETGFKYEGEWCEGKVLQWKVNL